MKDKNFFFLMRSIFYVLLFCIYIFFMQNISPLGVEWLDWHYQRLINVVQFLKINGYFTHYGFSIWTTVENCASDQQCWKNHIYLSHLFFSKIFYLFINEFFNENSFQFYGQIIDKLFIFFTAILISEILIDSLKKNFSKIQCFIISAMCFIFFVVNPWTYKMMIASWDYIFFLPFFLLGIFLFYKNKKKIGLIIIFFAGFFEYQLAAGVAVYYFLLHLLYITTKSNSFKNLLPFQIKKHNLFLSYNSLIVIILLLPVILHFLLQFYFLKNISYIEPSGTSLLTRMGISGDDIHNGGILGALQFLAGNRITICFENDIQNLINIIQKDNSTTLPIYIYNCLLSHTGIFLVSIISILFLLNEFRKNSFLKSIISPFIFLILCNSFILQQSSSVHLMGYSYLFSIIFSLGLSILFFNAWKKFRSNLTIVFLTPVFIGIILLCIRVSMLTGNYG